MSKFWNDISGTEIKFPGKKNLKKIFENFGGAKFSEKFKKCFLRGKLNFTRGQIF